jgi:RNA polymerase sigma-70 factor (ECF subfamily)
VSEAGLISPAFFMRRCKICGKSDFLRTILGGNYTIIVKAESADYRYLAGYKVETKPEALIVEAAQNGHLASFAVLYERYYGCMVALAYSVLADKSLAEDAAQESFAAACRDLPSLKSKDKFASWLAGICRNIAKQMQKSKGRFAALNGDAPTKEEKSYDSDLIRRAVWKLRTVHREPIVLRYYNGLSYEQISLTLGISQQAVHGRLTRAKRKIAKYLKRNGFTGGAL